MKDIIPSTLFILVVGLALPGSVHAQDLDNASSVEVYKTVDGTELKAWIFNPPDHDASEQKAAIVFFFGGGWNSGTPKQFEKHCEYLAMRNMVAIAVDYRVFKRQGTRANKCVADAKSAIRWMRINANRLGIDPNKIVASGGSAGGHLAASTATLSGHNEASDDLEVSAIPNALALFNPVLVLDQIAGEKEIKDRITPALEERMGAPPISMSPFHHLKSGVGPTIIFHGTGDKTVAFRTAELFDKRMDELYNDCTLVAYENEGHGFFNFKRKNNGPYISTLEHLDKFLVDLEYIEAPPKYITR